MKHHEALPFYWQIQSFPDSKELVTYAYDHEKNIQERFVEVFQDTGAYLVEYTFFHGLDSTKTIIMDNTVFNWSKKDTSLYKIAWTFEGVTYSFQKSRFFESFERIEVMGRHYKAAKFRCDYLIYDSSTHSTIEYVQFDYYIKGYGLVRFTRVYDQEEEDWEMVGLND